jgi:hypothetical protein
MNKEEFLSKASYCISYASLSTIDKCGIFLPIPPKLRKKDVDHVTNVLNSYHNNVVRVIDIPGTKERILLVSSRTMSP